MVVGAAARAVVETGAVVGGGPAARPGAHAGPANTPARAKPAVRAFRTMEMGRWSLSGRGRGENTRIP